MHFIGRSDHHVPFAITTSPEPAELGRTLEARMRTPRALLQLRFGKQAAALAIRDVWSACCELLLAAELLRERKLDRFILDVEQVFDVAYDGDTVLCIFSPEHVFRLSAERFTNALEGVVDEILSGTSCPPVMRIAAAWGASQIRAQPYSARFSNSLLM